LRFIDKISGIFDQFGKVSGRNVFFFEILNGADNVFLKKIGKIKITKRATGWQIIDKRADSLD